jgi:hypothetical protein
MKAQGKRLGWIAWYVSFQKNGWSVGVARAPSSPISYSAPRKPSGGNPNQTAFKTVTFRYADRAAKFGLLATRHEGP